MKGALFAEEEAGVVKEEGEESGADGRSGKRALERVVVEEEEGWALAVDTSAAEGVEGVEGEEVEAESRSRGEGE